MLNKNESRTVAERQFADENYDFNNDVMTPAFNDVKDNPFDILYAQVNNLKLLSNDEVITSKYMLRQNGQAGVVMPIQPKPINLIAEMTPRAFSTYISYGVLSASSAFVSGAV